MDRIDIQSRTVFLFYDRKDEEYDLDEDNAAVVLSGIWTLAAQSPAPIHLVINNQGGDQQQGLAIYDLIRNISNPVHGYVYGRCHSIATWILQACDIRYASQHSELMIHEGQKPRKQTEFQRKQDVLANDLLLERIREKHPGYKRARLTKLLAQDTYLSAREAQSLGLVDVVLVPNASKKRIIIAKESSGIADKV